MISIIVAIANNGVIGANNTLPWRLPADLKYFRATTMGHTIVMGRKNYEDIGKALPGRRNVVLTRDKNFSANHCEVVHSINDVVSLIDREDETFIIGGAEVYRSFLPLSDKLYITHIDSVVDGNIFFPDYDASEWELVSEGARQTNEESALSFRFCVYRRHG